MSLVRAAQPLRRSAAVLARLRSLALHSHSRGQIIPLFAMDAKKAAAVAETHAAKAFELRDGKKVGPSAADLAAEAAATAAEEAAAAAAAAAAASSSSEYIDEEEEEDEDEEGSFGSSYEDEEEEEEEESEEDSYVRRVRAWRMRCIAVLTGCMRARDRLMRMRRR